MKRPDILALLAECKDRPEDAPRLVLADWLEDHGDEAERGRAELIRLQCERSHLRPHLPRHVECLRREEELVAQYGATWLAPLGLGVEGLGHQRGLARVKVAERSLVGKRMTALAPTEAWAWVEHVQVAHAGGYRLREVVASPLLASVRGLDLSWCRLTPAHFGVLGGADLGHLRELGLGYNFLDVPGTVTLRKLEWGRNLTVLDLQQNVLRIEGVRELARTTNFPNLEEINLLWDFIGAEGMEALASSPHFPRMRRLNLYGNRIGDAGARALAAAPFWDHLTHLELSNCAISDAGVQALAESPKMAHLIVLELRDNAITDRGAGHLALSPHLANLSVLDVRETHIGLAGAAALRKDFGDRVRL